MGGRALVEECRRCRSVRPIRSSSGMCYSCHWHEHMLPGVKVSEPVGGELDPEELARSRLRGRVRAAWAELSASWVNDDTPEALERQELAAWDLIEAVEDLLGKE